MVTRQRSQITEEMKLLLLWINEKYSLKQTNLIYHTIKYYEWHKLLLGLEPIKQIDIISYNEKVLSTQAGLPKWNEGERWGNTHKIAMTYHNTMSYFALIRITLQNLTGTSQKYANFHNK